MKPLYCLEEVDTANQLLKLPRAWVEKLKEFLICRNILVPTVLVIRKSAAMMIFQSLLTAVSLLSHLGLLKIPYRAYGFTNL